MNRRDVDEIDGRLAGLRRPTLEADADARIHGRSRAAFLASPARIGAPPAPGGWARLWSRALEPIVVAVVVVGYVGWTAHALAAIDWGRTLAQRPAMQSPPPNAR
jgi:hypothetical protein